MTTVLAAGLLAAPLVSVIGGDLPSGAATTVTGTYVPVTPARLADTRANSGYQDAGSTLVAGGTINVQVTGEGNVPATGVSAVVLNVAAVTPSTSTYISVYPEGTTQPLVANMNVSAGAVLSNLVTVPVGTQGGVTLYNHEGSVDLVVDVEGYYTDTPGTTGFYDAVNPNRVATAVAVPAGTSLAVTVTGGSTGVPADATAVVANVTGTGDSSATYLTVYPAGVTKPTAASLNSAPGQIIGNRVTVPVGTGGQIEVYNNAGTSDVYVDLFGYYTGSAGESGSAFTPITPTRLVDTRSNAGGTPIAGASTETFSFAGDSIPTTATALVTNVTAVAGAVSGYLTVYPTSDAAPPTVADMNFPSNGLAQNFTLAPLTSLNSDFYNSGSTALNVVVDAFGYFGPLPVGVTVSASPSTVPADGLTTSIVTIAVSNAAGPIVGDAVTLTSTASVTGACGSLTAAANTNASGQTTSTYTPSKIAGICTITATEGNNKLTGTTTITQTSSAQGLTPGTPGLSMAVSPATITATPASTSTISVLMDNASGAPVFADGINITLTPSVAGACGGLNNGEAGNPNGGQPPSTAANGETTTTYDASTTPGTCTVTATEANTAQTAKATITQTGVNTVVLTAGTPTIAADGVSTSTLSAKVTNSAGVAVTGDTVSFTTSGATSPATCGSISPTSATTNGAGIAAASYLTSTTSGFCTITATESALSDTGTVVIDQTNPTVAALAVSVAATPSTITANGTSTSAVTGTVTTAQTRANVVGDEVELTVSPSTCGTVSPPFVTTNGSGAFSATYTSSTTGGTCTITALEAENAVSNTTMVVQKAVNEITVTPAASTIPGDGATTDAISIVVTTATGAAVPGDTLNLVVTGQSCGTLSSPTATTNASGDASDTYTASLASTFCTISVNDPTTTPNGPSTMIDQSGQSSPTAISITGSSTSLQANGASTSTLTITVKSGTSPYNGDAVSLSESPSALNACGHLNTAAPAATSTNGTTSAVYTAGSAVGTCTITATEADNGLTSSVAITQTGFNTVAISPATTTDLAETATDCFPVLCTRNPLSTTQSFTATVTNQAGGPVSPSDVVTFATSGSACGTLSTASGNPAGTVNNGGAVTVTYTTSSSVGFCTLKATESQFGGTASVEIDQESSPAVTAPTVTLSASPSTLTADGVSQSTVSGTVATGGTADSGDLVYLSGSGNCGSFTSNVVSTSATGAFTATYVSGTTGGTCTITAQEATAGSTKSTSITEVAANVVTVTSNPTSLIGNGAATSTITVTVKSSTGAVVSGDAITFTVVGNGNDCGTISNSTSPTSGTGVVTATYTAGVGSAFCTVVATETAGTHSTGQFTIRQSGA